MQVLSRITPATPGPGPHQKKPASLQAGESAQQDSAPLDVRATPPARPQVATDNPLPLSPDLAVEWSRQLAAHRAGLEKKVQICVELQRSESNLKKLEENLHRISTDRRQTRILGLAGFLVGLFCYRYVHDLSPIRPGIGLDPHPVNRSAVQQLAATCRLLEAELGAAAAVCERLYNIMPNLAELVDFLQTSENLEFARVYGIEHYGIEKLAAAPADSHFRTMFLVALTCFSLITLFVLQNRLTAAVKRQNS